MCKGHEMSNWKIVPVRIDETTIATGDPRRIIDPVWWLATFYDGPEAYEESLKRFSKPQRLVWAMLWYVAEVDNGGHDQFYSNSTGMVWRDALEGFELLGISEISIVLYESALRMGGSPALDRETRQRQMRETNANFDDLDDQFYDFDESGSIDLNAMMMEFIRSNATDFYFDGLVEKPVR
jgi:hypothetical protein